MRVPRSRASGPPVARPRSSPMERSPPVANAPGDVRSMRVALTGASGIVGRFIAARLAREGCDVVALARPGSDRTGFDFPVAWIEGDLNAEAALHSLVQGADALVHSAYDHVPGLYRGGEGNDVEGYWRTNLLGSLRLLHAANGCDVGRVVVLSSRAVFGRLPRQRESATIIRPLQTHITARTRLRSKALPACIRV